MSDFILGAYWPQRREELGQCVERLAIWMESIKSQRSEFENWFKKGYSKKNARTTEINFGDMAQLSKFFKGDSVFKELGYKFSCWNGADEGSDSAVNIACGSYSKNQKIINSLVLTLPASMLDNTNIIKTLLENTASIWEAEWAAVYSRQYLESIAESQLEKRSLYIDWMLFLRDHKSIDISKLSTSIDCEIKNDKSAIIVTRPQAVESDQDKENKKLLEDVIKKYKGFI